MWQMFNGMWQYVLDDMIDVMVWLFWGCYVLQGDYVYNLLLVGINCDLFDMVWYGMEFKFVMCCIECYMLVIGMELQCDYCDVMCNFDIVLYVSYLDDYCDNNCVGVYVQD